MSRMPVLILLRLSDTIPEAAANCADLSAVFNPRIPFNGLKIGESCSKRKKTAGMFPITDSSETIIQCLLQEAKRVGVEVRLERGIQHIARRSQGGFQLS